MKTKLLTALVVLGTAAGCVAVDTPVDIGNAKPLDAECKRDDSLAQGAGMLNVAAFVAGERPAYNITFDVISTLQPVEVSSSSGTITDPQNLAQQHGAWSAASVSAPTATAC